MKQEKDSAALPDMQSGAIFQKIWLIIHPHTAPEKQQSTD